MSKSLVFNKIPLEEIEIGMTVSYSQTITDTDIKEFAGLSGDRNPVHLDENYANNSRFKKRIAHGMMTASYFSALFGTKIPGEGCVYTYQSLNFKKPVYINDTVEAIVTVTGIDLEKRRVKFKTVCRVDKKIVTYGEAELYVPIEFRKIMINDKSELLQYKAQILDLFEHSFGSKMDESLWDWAYIENPNGNPIVSLYFDGEKLVGHYAVIPIRFILNQKNLDAVLSMTTMVDLAYRKYGIFIEQANEVYEKANGLGYKFVCGFPNKKSAPGFKKRLDWILEEDLYVANFSYDELQQIERKSYPNAISFNIQNKENLEWRLAKANQNYFKKNNNILKEFEGNFDIIFNGVDFSNLDRDKKYNLLLDHSLDKHLDKKEFDYIFGYRLFDISLEGIEFKKDLIISDVF
ncbi:GNAT family N-acetyltransferase [Arcobacter roscoffensis]|uniref:GNAT family N-acetyltransferase n=1 Tax=Arcobacter roscoffensis TaxID=2961520 RepID=A0ABY5E591_9BACT|nr:GNAT family N-acetyltransferase [Arcobacter roscoffensis]UTJ07334.1 GNAT family N-acetyltransferase [Arcobacter roscoffensis]